MPQDTAIQQVLTAGEAAAGGAAERQLAADVLLVKAWDGSSRLMDLGGECFGLSAVSTVLLEATLRDGPEAAAEQAARQYAVPVERIRADFEPFLSELERRGLLVPKARPSRRRDALRAVKAWPLGVALRLALRTIRSDAGRAGALLALASVCLKLLGWAGTVRLWQAACVGKPAAPDQTGDPARLERMDQAVRGALSRSVFPVDCKARALCGWAMLHAAGLPARLVVGVDLFPFLGHCWCESGARILADRIDRCGRFTPVLQYS